MTRYEALIIAEEWKDCPLELIVIIVSMNLPRLFMMDVCGKEVYEPFPGNKNSIDMCCRIKMMGEYGDIRIWYGHNLTGMVAGLFIADSKHLFISNSSEVYVIDNSIVVVKSTHNSTIIYDFEEETFMRYYVAHDVKPFSREKLRVSDVFKDVDVLDISDDIPKQHGRITCQLI